MIIPSLSQRSSSYTAGMQANMLVHKGLFWLILMVLCESLETLLVYMIGRAL